MEVPVKRIFVLSLTAGAMLAQAATAASETAPLAPVNTSLLQGHPGAPNSIDDVLLAPSASAGQKGAAFEWADGNHTQAYILWDKFFAAAEYTPAPRTESIANDGDTVTMPTAQTRASFGYMTPGLGFGLSLAYRDSTMEDVQSNKDAVTLKFSQIKLFASAGISGMDVYGSLLWAKPTMNWWHEPSGKDGSYVIRTDSVMLQVGARKAPAVGADGLAWNANASLGYDYYRVAGADGDYIWLAQLQGQFGYVANVDGITFLPGADLYFDYANGKADPDYAFAVGVAPKVAVSVPLFEHWTLMGGARYALEQTLVDNVQGSPSAFADHGLISNTTGSVGLRYARDRWALEGQLANAFLSNGPQFISGATTSGLVASLGVTVNLK
jgi:hypothetical protein